MNSNALVPSMGVLKASEGKKKFLLSRHDPSEEVGFFVKHFWIVSWDLTGQDPYLQDVVPNPCVNLVIEKNRTGIFAPAKHKFSHLLKGKGRVFGVKFKPGGFYPFIKRPFTGLTDNPLKLMDVFGVEDHTIESAILSQAEDGAMIELTENFIRQKLPERDENVTLINRIVDSVSEDREITKVDNICERFDINKRKLQRIFDQYVGVSPKWVIKLYRLQNAAETMDYSQNYDLLKLSADLGYYDQSHFIKDFKAIIGKTPDEYKRR